MKYAALWMLAVTLAACSGDTSKEGAPNNGWELGDDAGNNSATNNMSGTTAPTNNATVAPTNNATVAPTNNATSTPTNNATSAPTNNATSTPTNNTTSPGGTLPEGEACTVNSECVDGLRCCPGFDGSGTCSERCISGGLCGGDDAECSGNRECCDLSGINQPDTCLRTCPDNSPPGMPCQNNNECAANEVCCLGLDGSGECTTECFTGGACAVDADCRNGQMCCDFNVTKVCLNQCSF